MPLTAEETKLKKLLKAAMVEVLEERRDLVRDALADAVEDIGLIRAIEAGSRSKAINRQKFSRFSGRIGEDGIQEQLRQRPKVNQEQNSSRIPMSKSLRRRVISIELSSVTIALESPSTKTRISNSTGLQICGFAVSRRSGISGGMSGQVKGTRFEYVH